MPAKPQAVEFEWWAVREKSGRLKIAYGQGMHWSEKEAWAHTDDLGGERPVKVKVTVQPIEGGD